MEALDQNNHWRSCEKKLELTIDNPFWQKWWFIGIVILVILITSLFIIMKRYKLLYKEEQLRSEAKAKFLEMEIKVLKSQMDPHFIFNSLNSIQQFIIMNENDKAQSYLSKFSRMLRMLLESNTKENIRLADELLLLEKYLEVESLRFSQVFEYKIVVKNFNPDNIYIPHFLIQPFVENAIWHGLLPKKGDKNLMLIFERISPYIISCIIEDNGVGRQHKSIKGPDKRISLAINLIRQRLTLMSTKEINYSVTIIDKEKDKGESEGTKVIVLLPVFNK
jgi:LytS/YehU family sensor histidine kinase